METIFRESKETGVTSIRKVITDYMIANKKKCIFPTYFTISCITNERENYTGVKLTKHLRLYKNVREC